jgi:hypothetical protein
LTKHKIITEHFFNYKLVVCLHPFNHENVVVMKKSLLILIFTVFSYSLFSQVGIGTVSPSPGALLDIDSSEKGLLIPRVNIADINTIAPVTGGATKGLLVYNNNATTGEGFYYWDSSKWVNLTNKDWKLNGNSSTSPGSDFLGTTDNKDLIIKTNNTEVLNFKTNGQIQAKNAGTASAPLFTWSGDANTGVFQISADKLGLSAGGLEFMRLSEGSTDEIIINESGDVLNVRIESNNNTHTMFSDGTNDAVIFGSTGNLFDNGSVFSTVDASPNYNTTIDYVADFDNGSSRGTTMGLGSIEYLVDGEAELFVSDSFSPNLDLTYDLGFSMSWRDIYASNFYTVSDINAKTNIKKMPYGLKEILKLNTISYQLKEDPFNENRIGLVAQEVNKHIKEATKTHSMKKNEAGVFEEVKLDKMRVSYNSLVPVLIQATKEQQELITKLEEKIEAQNQLLLSLEQRISNLEN